MKQLTCQISNHRAAEVRNRKPRTNTRRGGKEGRKEGRVEGGEDHWIEGTNKEDREGLKEGSMREITKSILLSWRA